MYKHKHSKSSLFLMEIILNILFFAILVTVCLQLFYKAHTLSDDSIALHQAVTTCQSVAEVCQSEDNSADAVLSIYPQAVASEDKIVIFYDADFNPCSQDDSSYEATLTGGVLSEEDSTGAVTLKDKSKGKEIYSLDFSTYTLKSPNTYKGGN